MLDRKPNILSEKKSSNELFIRSVSVETSTKLGFRTAKHIISDQQPSEEDKSSIDCMIE
jgi:hypothetical protein